MALNDDGSVTFLAPGSSIQGDYGTWSVDDGIVTLVTDDTYTLTVDSENE